MKLYKHVLLLCSFTALFATALHSQEISDFRIYPENQSNTDEVLLIITTSFPLTDCRLDSVHEFYACGAFAFDGFYNTGFTPGNCERTDTINLGILSDGMYIISYRMLYLGWTEVDKVDTLIVVGTTGINASAAETAEAFYIWPNPSKGRVSVNLRDNKIERLCILDASGTYHKEFLLNRKNRHSINDIYLSAGLYFCVGFSNNHKVHTSKFIVLE
jgi:hypothetical protein